MKRSDVEKVLFKVIAAEYHKDQIAKLAATMNVPAYSREWSAFLTSVTGIYESIRVLAEGNPADEDWLQQIFKSEIMKDPLLAWVRIARNASHHGIEQPSTPVASSTHDPALRFAGYEHDLPIVFTLRHADGTEQKLSGGWFVTEHGPQGLNIGETFTIGHRLVSVKDRKSGRVYQAPTMHLGMSIPDPSPAGVAALAFTYYQGLFETARRRAGLP